ncbi:putative YigZ family protein [Desulfobotulus alkaliphilus]|uniref:Putative YigZ family protein n=1 Tax=Desulfobotulus alkaliphilus TaxID=622671 RepID=A0A562RS88_9BACT|nr:YigZ family protein [Desulfobotulus alkaliphilus]TWI71176.1 putative YigZ family protein [Desulfobotulus alkaliphilus]
MRSCFYPLKKVEAETEVRKSRFLSFLFPCTGEDEAREQIRSMKAAHKNAAHVVHAFVLGQKEPLIRGMSDDGEPSGTAGRPVMALMDGRGLVNILLVIVRYFGGIRLGTGGLVKAYGDAAMAVLERAELAVFIEETEVEIAFPYALLGAVSACLASEKIIIRDEAYGEEVRMSLRIPKEKEDVLRQKLRDCSSGRIFF